MKSVALAEMTTRREEVLDGLAKGETFAVTNDGREVAALTPSQSLDAPPDGGNALSLIADLIGIDKDPVDPYDKKKRLASFGLDGPARRAVNNASGLR